MASALNIVQRFFPDVTVVKDATDETIIEVTAADEAHATKRNHKSCAMAVACKRKFNLDGVIISVKTAYLVKGRIARRFKFPESVSREVVSFDRNGGFAPGEYRLVPPSKGQRLGTKGGNTKHTGTGHKKVMSHFTTGIRTVLSSGDVS